MKTLREIFATEEEDMNKFVDDTLEKIVAVANDRVNGNVNNDEYKRRIEEIKRNVEAEKAKQRRIELIKQSAKIQQGAADREANNTVSTQVQKQV